MKMMATLPIILEPCAAIKNRWAARAGLADGWHAPDGHVTPV